MNESEWFRGLGFRTGRLRIQCNERCRVTIIRHGLPILGEQEGFLKSSLVGEDVSVPKMPRLRPELSRMSWTGSQVSSLLTPWSRYVRSRISNHGLF